MTSEAGTLPQRGLGGGVRCGLPSGHVCEGAASREVQCSHCRGGLGSPRGWAHAGLQGCRRGWMLGCSRLGTRLEHVVAGPSPFAAGCQDRAGTAAPAHQLACSCPRAGRELRLPLRPAPPGAVPGPASPGTSWPQTPACSLQARCRGPRRHGARPRARCAPTRGRAGR